jgi:hypothetical protein
MGTLEEIYLELRKLVERSDRVGERIKATIDRLKQQAEKREGSEAP